MAGLIIYYLQFKIASRSKDALIMNNSYGHSNNYEVVCINSRKKWCIVSIKVKCIHSEL